MTEPWTETGATWNCADDSVPGNAVTDCTRFETWDLETTGGAPPWTQPASAEYLGVIDGRMAFDVTADVVCALLRVGSPIYGWVITTESSRVYAHSRETDSGPELQLEVDGTELSGWRFSVDPSITPRAPSLPGYDGAPDRELTSLVTEEGVQIDFVRDELIFISEGAGAIDAFISEYSGEVLLTQPLQDGRLMSVVRVDLSGVDERVLPSLLSALTFVGDDHYTTSDPEAQRLLAVAARAAGEGYLLGINWLSERASIVEGSTIEGENESSKSATRDAFDWPHLKRGARTTPAWWMPGGPSRIRGG